MVGVQQYLNPSTTDPNWWVSAHVGPSRVYRAGESQFEFSFSAGLGIEFPDKPLRWGFATWVNVLENMTLVIMGGTLRVG